MSDPAFLAPPPLERAASYLHVLSGRVRVRLPLLRDAPRAAVIVRQALGRLVGVRNVQVSTLTGSLLIRFSPAEVSAQDLLRTLADSLPDAVSTENPGAPPAESPGPVSVSRPPATARRTRTPTIGTVLTKKTVELAAERLLLALLF